MTMAAPPPYPPPAAPKAPPPAPAASDPDGDGDIDAAGIGGLLQNAIAVALEEPAIAAAMKTVRVLTQTVQDDGSINVDVDGTSTVVAADELGAPAAGDSMPPPPPAAA